MKYVLGIDVGTSGTKTILFDETGKMIATETVSYEMQQPYPQYAEQNPEDWWQAVLQTIRNIVDQGVVDSNHIVGIGLSGQMHGLVLLDKNKRVLRPSIIWCDGRCEEEVKQINQEIGLDTIVHITGNPTMVSFTLAKLLWVKNHEPDIYREIRYILLPKDYIRFCLTGVFQSEYSDASGTQLLNINKKDFDARLIEYLQIKRAFLPSLGESTAVSGTILPSIAKYTGLQEKTIVVGGAGDQAANALGNGAIKAGDTVISLGSSGVVFTVLDHIPQQNTGEVQLFYHAVPNTLHVMGVTQGCGLSMKWLKENLYACEEKRQKGKIYDFINAEAEKSSPGSNRVLFLPYLLGERTPHLNPLARGVVFGLSYENKKCDIARAVMEGVAFSLKDCLEEIRKREIVPKHIKIGGGGSKSKLWKNIISDVLHEDLMYSSFAETGALGVAILAMVGAGIYSSIEEACQKIGRAYEVIQTNEANHKIYDATYDLYRDLYHALIPSFLKRDQIHE